MNTRNKRKPKSGNTLFVSPLGRDTWSGRYADPLPDNSDGPLATPAAARDRLRRTAATPGEKRVWIRGGVYFLSQPLVFGPEDCGTAAAPVVYAACPGESTVISGGRMLDGWQPGRINGRSCWLTKLPSGFPEFTQLFVNNERRCWSRLPKTGCYTWRDTPEIRPVTNQKFFDGTDRAVFKKGVFKQWVNQDDIRVTALNIWLDHHHRIRRIDRNRNMVYFRAKSITHLTDPGKQPGRFFMENVFEAVDEPGQWYLDRPSGKLYYLPMEGERLFNTELIAPLLETLVHVRGTARRPASHLRFENLSFRHAEWDYPQDDPGSIQAACKVPGAVVFERARHCALRGCEISQIAQAAVEIASGCHDIQVTGCRLHDLGGGGIRIGTSRGIAPGALRGKPAPTRNAMPMAATVEDCRIHDAGRKFISAVGIWIGNEGFNRIRHNEIFNIGYTGISCGWTWSTEPTTSMANRIENNNIHHINTERMLADNGGIYMLGAQPGTVLSGNHVHFIGCHEFGGFGIYLDEGSSNMRIERNLIHHTDGACFFMTGPSRDNIVRNNIFALPKKTILGFSGPGYAPPATFERNIVFWRRGRFQLWGEWPAGAFQMRNNLFWQGRDKPLVLGNTLWQSTPGRETELWLGTLDAWQREGQHVGSLHADPLFADPDGGDFTLLTGSPASRVGFKPFSVRSAGPRGINPASSPVPGVRLESRFTEPVVRLSLECIAAGRARVIVENAGLSPVSGSIRFDVWPPRAAALSTRSVIVRRLPPGRKRRFDLGFQCSPMTSLWMLHATPRNRNWMPAARLMLERPRLAIPFLDESPGSAGWERSLRAVTPVLVKSGSKQIAAVRIARTADALAVMADVRDSQPTCADNHYPRSGLEVFSAPCPVKASRVEVDRGVFDGEARGPVSSVMLSPAVDGARPGLGSTEGAPLKPIPAKVRLCADGYRISAQIPNARLNIPSDARQAFLLELAVTTHGSPGRPIRATLLGSPHPGTDSIRFCRVTTRQPAPGHAAGRRRNGVRISEGGAL